MRFTFSPVVSLSLSAVFALSSIGNAQLQPKDQTKGKVLNLPDAQVRLSEHEGQPQAAWREAGGTWKSLQRPDGRIMFRYGVIDPGNVPPVIPGALHAPKDNRLFLVQFHTQPIEAYRQGLANLGIEIFNWLPYQTYVVRMPASKLGKVQALPFVRWAGAFHLAWKLEPQLAHAIQEDRKLPKQRYNIVVLEPARDRQDIEAEITAAGGKIDNLFPENAVLEATLTTEQLVKVAGSQHVIWIDRWTPIEYDINNARIQGGANYIETKGGFTGKGVRGEIFEGVYDGHKEWAATSPHRAGPIVHRSGNSSHGSSTYGEIFAKGVTSAARGLLPDGQGIYAYNGGANVTTVIKDLVDPTKAYKGMFQTASWGGGRTLAYNSTSVTLDNALFLYDLVRTTSQSNAGGTSVPRNSRPQAWCKNVISGGGIRHYNNSKASDDRWAKSGSVGPASDGRIKPDLSAYYDSIYCATYVYNSSTRTYVAGYTSGFGGTSGATPIIAGHAGLVMELYTDGLFGNKLPKAPTWQNRFDNKPHMTTVKALLINGATQYPFSGTTAENKRTNVGWGFPTLNRLYDLRDKTLVLNEIDVLKQGETSPYVVWVPTGTAELKVTMTYADPAGTANSTVNRVNDLSLRVKKLPGGVTYWGNNGLVAGNYSSSGGSADTRDTVENVFIKNPARGFYSIEVVATSVVKDAHKETTATDADYAMVVSGIGAGRDRSEMELDFASSGTGNLTINLKNLPAGYTEGFTLFSLTTPRHVGLGRTLGMTFDSISWGSFGVASAAGNPFHFPAHKALSYPNALYTFPAGLAVVLKGVTIDALAFVVDSKAEVMAFSNVSRVTVK